MLKKYIVILTFVIIILFLTGCTNQSFNFNSDQSSSGGISDLSAIIQLSDFSNSLSHEYSSISGNGQKIIYNQYPTETYPLAETDFTVSPRTIWVTDTSGSKVQTQIFDGWDEGGLYAFYGSNGGTPVLNYDATYAYFGVEKYINYIGYYWLPAHNPNYLARVKLSTNSFHPIDLIQNSGYDFTWLECFRIGSNNIYCLVTFRDEDGMGNKVKAVGFIKMNLDGSGQELIYIETDLTTESCPRTGYTFFLDESNNRLYYESKNFDYYYYLSFNTNTPVKINNEELGDYWLRGNSGSKLIFYDNQEFYIYNINTDQFSKINCQEDGYDLYSITSDKIFYCAGNGLFSYTDFDGNYVKLIGMDPGNFSDYNGRYEWDIQFTPTNGKPVSDDGTRLLVKENHNDNPNYYILKLSGSSSNGNSYDSDDTDDDTTNDDTATNPAIIIHSIQMFDFSTGQYVSEDWTTEDLDVIVITNDNKARLYAHNNALIRELGVTEFLSYIDVSAGSTCELVDSAGGTATFTVNSIGTTIGGYPTATITWSYSP